MIRNVRIKSILDVQKRIFLRNSSTLNIEKLEKESTEGVSVDVYDEEAARREEEIEQKRNKSRLRVADRNILHDKVPYTEPKIWTHGTLKYNRKMYGRYGKASGVNPVICWPTQQELKDKIEYEQVAYPFTIPEMIETSAKARKEKEDRIMARQMDMVERMKKLDGWIKDMRNRAAKKESEATEARTRRERLIEEVKAHFGFTVDPKDDKFKDLLEKKEKEQKKAMKEQRKKMKEQKIMEMFVKKPEPTKADT